MLSKSIRLDAEGLLNNWRKVSKLPGGKVIFSQFIKLAVPYTGTLGAVIDEMEPGKVVAKLRDRRKVRNHLNSVHAMALANLGELATGVALLTSLPAGMRGILVGYSITYLKKARGELTAKAVVPPITSQESKDLELEGNIFNAGGEEVARVAARWRIGPNKK